MTEAHVTNSCEIMHYILLRPKMWANQIVLHCCSRLSQACLCSILGNALKEMPRSFTNLKYLSRKRNHFLLFGRSHPWKDTLGKDEDIWRYSICHICWRLSKFTSTLSLPCELPCIPWMMLWSSELPVSRLLKPASNNHSALAAVSTALLYCCLE